AGADVQREKLASRAPLFTPLVPVGVCPPRGLAPAPSCGAPVARFLAWRAAGGKPPCSANPGAYCKARGRLPEGVLARLTRTSGRDLQDQTPTAWRWEGRPVKVVDGTTVSMPDTPANQKAFPQSPSQKAGVGFPIARLV